ncbi:MAG: hypothetical protein U1F59_09835 [Candidatus Competibacteraceae bacterium]
MTATFASKLTPARPREVYIGCFHASPAGTPDRVEIADVTLDEKNRLHVGDYAIGNPDQVLSLISSLFVGVRVMLAEVKEARS